METLGVKAPIFLRLQDAAVKTAKEALDTPQGTATLLRTHGLGKSYRLASTFELVEKFGLQDLFLSDRTLARSRHYAYYHVLRDMKYKARVPSK